MQKSNNNTPNMNGRIYPKETLEKAIEDLIKNSKDILLAIEKRNEKKKIRKDKLLRLNDISNKKQSNSNGGKP